MANSLFAHPCVRNALSETSLPLRCRPVDCRQAQFDLSAILTIRPDGAQGRNLNREQHPTVIALKWCISGTDWKPHQTKQRAARPRVPTTQYIR